MMTLLLVWILNAVALLVVAYVLPGIVVASFGSAMLAALVLGLINMLVKPVLVLLTLPITIVTLGLFLLVLNALMFWFAGSILKGFQVNGFWWAVGGAILYSLPGECDPIRRKMYRSFTHNPDAAERKQGVAELDAKLRGFNYRGEPLVNSLTLSSDKPVVVGCASGTRSAMARMLLKKNGHTEVYNIGTWRNFMK